MKKGLRRSGLFMLLAAYSVAALSATPGIPFTEDFSDTALDASAITTASWDTAAMQLILPEDTSFTPAVPATDVPINTTSNPEPSFAMLVADFDNDGVTDDIISGGDSGLWLNADIPLLGSNIKVRSVEAVDLDGDGDLDLIIAVKNGTNLSIENHVHDPFTPYSTIPFFYEDGNFPPNLVVQAPVELGNDIDDTRAVKIADINRDGIPDYVFGNAGATVNKWVDGNTLASHAIGTDMLDTRAISLADVDNDGDIDVITGNASALNKVYLNDGAGNFPGTGQAIGSGAFATRSIASADLNGDGLIDIAVGTSGGMGYFLNAGVGTLFSAATGRLIGASTAVVTDLDLRDVNNDGLVDVLAGRRNTANALFLNSGNANPFTSSTAEHALSIDTEDTRSIGAVINNGFKIYSANNSQLNRKEGLQMVTHPALRDKVQDISALLQPGKAVASGDVDNDGDLDFVIGNAAGTANELFINDGSGQFSRQQLSDDGDTRAVLLSDINHDGMLDLITGNYGATNRIYINYPFGSLFSTGLNLTADTHNTTSLGVGDFNSDGRLDIVAGNLGQNNRLYLNGLPAGTFSSGSNIEATASTLDTRALAVSDVDMDGDPDILFANSNGPNHWANNTGAGVFTTANFSPDNHVSYAVAVIQQPGAMKPPAIVVANNGSANRHYTDLNSAVSGSGTDVGNIGGNTRVISVVDMDGNGVNDVLFGNASQSNVVFLNGNWASSTTVSNSRATRALSSGDFDGDGIIDIIEVNSNQTDRLYAFDHPPRYQLNSNIAQSLSIDNSAATINEVVLNVNETLPAGTSIDYYLTSNGGTDWYLATPGQQTAFANAGSDLRWRAELNSNSNLKTPVLTQLDILATRVLTVLPSAGGTITSSPAGIDCGANCEGRFALDSNVTLNVALNGQFAVSSWTGAASCGTSTSCTFLLDSSKTVSPIIEGINELTVSYTGNGKVTSDDGYINCNPSCSHKYSEANVGVSEYANLTASADPGWYFDSWTGACGYAMNPTCTLEMNASYSTQANFLISQRTLVVMPNAGINVTATPGAIDCQTVGDTCSTTQNYGTSVTLTAVAAGQNFVGWSGDCAFAAGNSTCTLILDSDKSVNTISANQPRTLSISNTAGGRIYSWAPGAINQYINCGVTCTAPFAQNEQVSLRAEAQPGFAFAGWDIAGCDDISGPLNNLNCYVYMTTDRTVTTAFIPVFTLDVTQSGPGLVSSQPAGILCDGNLNTDCTEDYVANTPVTLTAEPGAYGKFTGWSGNGCGGNALSCTITMDQARTISATFSYIYPLSVQVFGGGNVSSTFQPGINCPDAVCSADVPGSTVVTLNATPAADYDFSSWSGGGCSGNAGCTVTMDSEKSVSATFTLKQFGLTTVIAGSGTAGSGIASSPPGINCETDCFQNYDINSIVTLTATPAGNAYFSGWNNCPSAVANICSVTIDQAYTVTANFTKHFELIVNNAGGGTVSSAPAGIQCPLDCDELYDSGTSVTLTATPQSSDYQFDGWSGACVNGSGNCVVDMTQTRNVTANFSLKQFSLDVTITGNGAGGSSINSSPAGINTTVGDNQQLYDINTLVTLTATPSNTAYFSGWTGGGCDAITVNTCTVTMDQAYTVNADFTRHWELTVTNAGGGSVVSSPGGIDCPAGSCGAFFDDGTNVTLIATPESTDYLFSGWSGACTGSASCVVPMTQTRGVTASFVLKQFILSVSITGSGAGGSGITSSPLGINTIGGDNQQLYDISTPVTLTATPANAAYFSGWTGGGCDAITVNTCTVTMDQVYSVNADFTRHWELTVTNAGGGSVISGPGSIDCPAGSCSEFFSDGTNVTLIATPESTDYLFSGWSGACTGSASCVVPMTQTRSVTATFVLKQFMLSVSTSGSGAGGSGISSSPAGINTIAGDNQQLYDINTLVTLTATPANAAYFSGWTGGGCDAITVNTCTVTIDQVYSVNADFTLHWELTVTNTGGGSVISSPGSIDCPANSCSEFFDDGTSVTLLATPDSTDYLFSGWNGACTGSANCVVPMTQARSVTATFALKQYSLLVSKTGSGAANSTLSSDIAGINCGLDCQQLYDIHQVVILTATPSANTLFSGWTNCPAASGNTCTVTMDAPGSVSAEFLQQQDLSVSLIGNGGGTVSSVPAGSIDCGTASGIDCSETVNQGNTITLSASTDSFSDFTGWFDSPAGTTPLSACSNAAANCSITLNADQAVYPQFVLRQQTLNVSQTGHGTLSSTPAGISTTWLASGSSSDTQIYNADQSVSLTPSPATGWRLDSWSGDCSGILPCSVDMTSDRTVAASFAINQYNLAVQITGLGSVSSDLGLINCAGVCNDNYDYGTTVTLTATPADPSWLVAEWSGVTCLDYDPQNPQSCQISIPDSNLSASVIFAQSFTLNVSRNGSGLGTVNDGGSLSCGATCSALYTPGASVTLSAIAQAGSVFTGWSLPGCSGTGDCTFTINANQNITATFDQLYTLSVNPGAGGSITADVGNINCGANCQADYADGTLVTLSPVPEAGQVFTGWSGDCSGSGACSVTMSQARTVGADFDLDGPTLTVNISSGHGSVSSQPAGINCGATCIKNFPLNTSLTLTATADAGYLLADWGHADCTGTGNCQLTMDVDKTLNTLFAPDSDGDGIIDSLDNCPADANPDQADANSDGEGDVCDSNSDTDSDGVFDNLDNCPLDANPGQEDNNGFDDVPGSAGDACEVIEDETLCFPVKLSGGAVAVICL